MQDAVLSRIRNFPFQNHTSFVVLLGNFQVHSTILNRFLDD